MQNNQQYTQLIQMGCSPILSEAAIANLKSQDLSALLDWISDQSEEEQKWKAWLEQNKNAPKNQQVQAEAKQSIDHLVNKQMSQQLQSKGYSKNVAQKSLLFTSSMSVKAAENWIQDHKYDLDFEEQVFITGQGQNQPKLTPEQAKQKLKELTEKARAIKKQKQEQEAKQRQKNRLRSGKQMAEAKRILQQQSMKRQVQLDKIQKAKDEAYKKQLLQQMRRQKMAKLGKQMPASTTGEVKTTQQKPEIKYTKEQQIEIQCEQVKVGMHAYPDKAKIFFETAQIYVNNIIKNNGEQKFRKINKQNKAFQSRVIQVFGGIQTLLAIGYVQQSGFLILKELDLKELQKISNLLQRYINYY